MKLASGIAPDNSPIQKLAFSLLANLAMSRDCRGLLQKVQAWYTVYSTQHCGQDIVYKNSDKTAPHCKEKGEDISP